MDAHLLRDVGHGQRTELGGAMLEEIDLTLDDDVGELLDGTLALFNRADEELALTHALEDVGPFLVAEGLAGEHVLVGGHQAELGDMTVVHDDLPLAVIAQFDAGVGRDHPVIVAGESTGGHRLELGEFGEGLADIVELDVEHPGTFIEPSTHHRLPAIGDETRGGGKPAAALTQLGEETLPKIAGADARRIKSHQQGMGRRDGLVRLAGTQGDGRKVFLDEATVAGLEKKMFARGYHDGGMMAGTFNMLRANDLIWSFVVNNYLLGRDPFPFDLLHWNGDSTRMPAAMHSFYLRNLYLKNLLREPGGITLAGTPIDITQSKIPAYFLSTVEDHIAPWQSTYAGARLLKGPVRFVLGGSGHIAGVINPPAVGKYGYWTHSKLPAKPEDWLASAKQHAGSWWTDWSQWVSGHAGAQIAPRVPGKGKYKALEDAPGSYVKRRIG